MISNYEKCNKNEHYNFRVTNSLGMKPRIETMKIIEKLLNNMHSNLLKIRLVSDICTESFNNLPCTIIKIHTTWHKTKINYLPNSTNHLEFLIPVLSQKMVLSNDTRLYPQYPCNSIITMYSSNMYMLTKIPIHLKKMFILNKFYIKKTHKLIKKYIMLENNYDNNLDSCLFHVDSYNYNKETDFFIKN